MLMCRIAGCIHKASRQAKQNLSRNCWGKWQICVCCAVEFELVDSYQSKSLGCKYLLQQELKIKLIYQRR